jgi:hypothetical protein
MSKLERVEFPAGDLSVPREATSRRRLAANLVPLDCPVLGRPRSPPSRF